MAEQMADTKIAQQIVEKLNVFVKQRNDLDAAKNTRALKIIEEKDYIEANLTAGSADYIERTKALDLLCDEQIADAEKVIKFDKVIESLTPSQMAAKMATQNDFSEFIDENGELLPVSGRATTSVSSTFSSRIKSTEEKSEDLAHRIGTDIWNWLRATGLNKKDRWNNIKSFDTDGLQGMHSKAQFKTIGTFTAAFGETDVDRNNAIKSLQDDGALWASDTMKSLVERISTRRNAIKSLARGITPQGLDRDAVKSMYLQIPNMAGGDGAAYQPFEIYAGNSGGLCEYDIDREIAELPYAEVGFLDCIPSERISKSWRMFVRQALRINNADSVNETIYAPPIDYIVTKPESHYGFVQERAYTVVFANTTAISDEFLEECEPLIDIIRNQLMRDALEAYYMQLLFGDGRVGKHPQLLGFFNQVGMSTRIHRGAAKFNGEVKASGKSTDRHRDTIVRGIWDAKAFGYKHDCVIMSQDDYVDMSLERDNQDRLMYTQAELDNISGAKVTADTRVPAGLMLSGAFGQVAKTLIRRTMQFDVGYVNNQFNEDMQTFRCRFRAGNMVRQAFGLTRYSKMNT